MSNKTTKRELEAMMRTMLDRIIATGMTPDDQALLCDILKPVHVKLKGHDKFYVKVASNRTIYTYDMTVIRPYPLQISWRKALGLVTHRGKVMSIARRWTAPMGPKDFSKPCTICGEPFTVEDEAPTRTHWDHYPHSFVDIFKEWSCKWMCDPTDPESIPLTPCGSHFLDADQEEHWFSYHKRHAKFRLVHAHCNLIDREREPFW